MIDHLRQTGYLSDEAVIKRSHWSQKRKEKYATEAMRTMVENDEVKKLWRDFHINLRTARESVVCPIFCSHAFKLSEANIYAEL